MNLLLVLQILLASIAAVVMIQLWREGMPDREHLFSHSLKAASAVIAIVGVSTIPLVALAMSGVQKTAKIKFLDCQENSKSYVSFEYVVNGKSFNGKDLDNIAPRACHGKKLGDEDTIVYLPRDPSVYVWRSPWPHLRFALFASIFLVVGTQVLAFRQLVRSEA